MEEWRRIKYPVQEIYHLILYDQLNKKKYISVYKRITMHCYENHVEVKFITESI